MIGQLNQLDHELTIWLNNQGATWLDPVMHTISGKWTWIPLYAVLAYLLWKQYHWKSFVLSLLAVTLCIVLCDQISVAMKFGFERLRPCHEHEINPLLRIPFGCGGKFGFVSSHAANTMGLAALMGLMLRKRWVWVVMLSFALLNSYSRIYLAAHYLGDVLGGMLLGLTAAFVCYLLFTLSRKQLNFVE